MITYAIFDHYPITYWQRILIKLSIFSAALMSFLFVASVSQSLPGNEQRMNYFQLQIIPLGLPVVALDIAKFFVLSFSILFFAGVVVYNFNKHRKKPSLQFLVPWVALLFWWYPMGNSAEYYIMAVPFFHSLQYLPFAHRMSLTSSKRGTLSGTYLLQIFVIVFLGFLLFELVPGALDAHFASIETKSVWFFMISFVTFINIHHYFIDSVIWRFSQSQMREKIFGID